MKLALAQVFVILWPSLKLNRREGLGAWSLELGAVGAGPAAFGMKRAPRLEGEEDSEEDERRRFVLFLAFGEPLEGICQILMEALAA